MATFCGTNQKNTADYFDPLGPNAAGQTKNPTGGPEKRSQIFGQLDQMRPDVANASGQAIQATREAATNPLWSQAQSYAGKAASGGYLQANPYLTQALGDSRKASDTAIQGARDQAMADLEGQQATNRSDAARAGVSWGTGQTQAADAAKAATAANLARGAQQAATSMDAQHSAALAENYARERQAQAQAVGMVPQLATGQSQILQQIPGQYYDPVVQESEIVRGLAGGGQAIQPTIVRKPGIFDYGTQLLSATSSGM